MLLNHEMDEYDIFELLGGLPIFFFRMTGIIKSTFHIKTETELYLNWSLLDNIKREDGGKDKVSFGNWKLFETQADDIIWKLEAVRDTSR